MEEKLLLDDLSNDLLIINRTTIERLFQEDNKEIVVLYMFYYKTAKWQNHNPIKANDEYTKKCLHWGTDKLKTLKNRLKEMELIEIEKRLNDKKQIVGWYIKLNYYKTTTPETTTPISPLVASQETNTINNNINTNNNKNTKERNIKKEFTKPTLEEVEAYCKERHNTIDPKVFYDYYEVSNWKDIKNWKQKLITWETHQRKPSIEVTPAWFGEKPKNNTKEEQEEFEDILDSFS